MKIVDEKPFNFEFECRGCKSKLAAEPKDVRMSTSDEGREYYVTCPLCGTYREVPYQFLTPKVLAMADRRGRR